MIEVRCRANETSEEGEFYVPVAYQNQIDLYPADLLANGSYAILHETSHTLNYFYRERLRRIGKAGSWRKALRNIPPIKRQNGWKKTRKRARALAYGRRPVPNRFSITLHWKTKEKTLYTEELSH